MKKPQTAHILTLMVDNEFGVLTRITAQIRREGWNIKSLAVAECMEPSVSRITLSLECFDTTLPNVVHRLSRLACVRSVTPCDDSIHLSRELAIVRAKPSAAKAVIAIAAEFGAKIVETEQEVTLELSGDPVTLDDFCKRLNEIPDVDVARTGPIVL
ncbi:acetolactate synthase small subunit [Eubacteriales bacterium OttesenSCG-928-K08]|nr:acetolactate synthase small subunit [Eubacteriales bacterium OttesenSCG-928-K08]